MVAAEGGGANSCLSLCLVIIQTRIVCCVNEFRTYSVGIFLIVKRICDICKILKSPHFVFIYSTTKEVSGCSNSCNLKSILSFFH